MRLYIYSFLFTLLFVFPFGNANAQDAPQGISYQGILRADDGTIQNNETILLIVGIRQQSTVGILLYEETHTVITNNDGWFRITVGEGDDSPNGSIDNFSDIPWGDDLMFLDLKSLEGGVVTDLGTEQLLSVPYALYAQKTAQQFAMTDLLDVDLTGLEADDFLQWNGSNWVAVPSADLVDSVAFAVNANQATYADTAQFAYTVLTVFADTALYATNAGNANTATFANTATYADSANYATTAGNALNAWNTNGNQVDDNVHFIGTTNDADVVLKTNNQERMRIKDNGNIGVGTTDPTADLHVHGDGGVIFEGTPGIGSIPMTGPGSRLMWYPGKSALRIGTTTGNQWDDNKIGMASFAGGLDSSAPGDYAFAMGELCEAIGESSAAFGWLARSTGRASFAVGPQSESTGFASIAMGRRCVATDTAAVALGYQNEAYGVGSVALGYQAFAEADYSTALGFKTHAIHEGSFIWRSNGVQTNMYTTAENQFLVAAKGEVNFYSSLDLSTGVKLSPGGGAWNTISDRNQKENFELVNGASVLDQIRNMEITSWNYKSQDPSIRHMGPMAQDFYAAYGLGNSEKTITTTDIDGVNMAALQELAKQTDELKEKSAEIEALKTSVDELQAEKIALQKRLERLEQLVTDLETENKD